MTEEVTEILKKIEAAEVDFTSLYRRMDDDYELWEAEDMAARSGEDYVSVSKTFIGQRDTDITFIGNGPRTFSDHLLARLSKAERQIIVRVLEKEGVDRREDTSRLERLIAFALDKADEKLTSDPEGIPMLDYLIWCAIVRGRMCGRVLVLNNNGKVEFDFRPFDPRYTKYKAGYGGISWISYSTWRTAEDIKDEYNKEVKNERNNEVIDYWKYYPPKSVTNSVICDRELLHREDYELERIPALYVMVPTVPAVRPARDGGRIRHGDSSFASVRDIFKFENDLISMWASHAKLLFKQPTLNYYADGGKELTTTAFTSEAVINLPMDKNKLEPSPVKEISNTLVSLVGLVSSMRQRGTLPDIEYGELKGLTLSGTAINELKEARDKAFGPIVRALNTFYTQLCYQVETQLLAQDLPVTVQTGTGKKFYQAEVKPVDLKETHAIRVEFVASTAWTQMDTYQIADMARRLGLPDEFIWEYIIKVPDPKGLKDSVAVEIAERSPKLLQLKAIKTLIREGREEEATDLIEDLYTQWTQEQEGMQQSPFDMAQDKQEPQPQGVLQ